MSDNVLINFSDAKGYTPYEGTGAAALLPFDGMLRARIIKFKTGTSSKGNKTVKLTMAIAEDDVKGTLYSDIPVTGEDKNGEKLVRKFFDLLISSGQSLEQLNTAAESGQTASVEDLVNGLISNQTVIHIDVEASSYEGRTTSKVKNFVAPQRFSDSVTAGTARRPRAASNGATTVAAAGNAGAQAGAAAVANLLAT